MLDPTCALETAVSTDSLALEAAVALAESSPAGPPTVPHPRNYRWSELMKRVWALDVLECPRCLSRMRILAAIHPPDAHSENSGVPSATVARTACGPGRFQTLGPTGMVMNTAKKPGAGFVCFGLYNSRP